MLYKLVKLSIHTSKLLLILGKQFEDFIELNDSLYN